MLSTVEIQPVDGLGKIGHIGTDQILGPVNDNPKRGPAGSSGAVRHRSGTPTRRVAGRLRRRHADDGVGEAGRCGERPDGPPAAPETADDGDAIAGSDLAAVTRLMGFLRGDD